MLGSNLTTKELIITILESNPRIVEFTLRKHGLTLDKIKETDHTVFVDYSLYGLGHIADEIIESSTVL